MLQKKRAATNETYSSLGGNKIDIAMYAPQIQVDQQETKSRKNTRKKSSVELEKQEGEDPGIDITVEEKSFLLDKS